ncbi:Uncharacterized protein YhfF [Agreia bicolorata]|uniref:Uncharacterized protein YhfF n=1 Tax=Agreia bicolorata TaxID=110935 RepID=A0A1T4Y7A9_9MICO|nr:ASCH domain-containing protein [Agreia bicolorata]SKA97606.1 Uncharacterized protein YhfF [Agreia bicolorata]
MTDELPTIEFAFPGELRDRIIAAIESGAKTATSSLVREYEIDKDPLPVAGFRGAVLDSNGARIFTIETTRVDVVELHHVPLRHALAEGEGYESVADWRAGHERFWRSPEMRAVLGSDFDLNDNSLVVLEQFEVVE